MRPNNALRWQEICADAFGARMWHEARTSWAIALLCRPPSVPVTWALARAGLGPMAVTGLGLVLALAMPLLALGLPLAAAMIGVAVAGYLFQVLDCVDGTLARVTNRVTRKGADTDFLVDMAQWGMLYLSLGLLADRVFETFWFWSMIGASAAWLRLMARVIRDRLGGSADGGEPLRVAHYPVAFVAGLSGLIPFLALAGPWLDLALLGVLIYALLDIAEALLPLIGRRE